MPHAFRSYDLCAPPLVGGVSSEFCYGRLSQMLALESVVLTGIVEKVVGPASEGRAEVLVL